jgi:hypothetical protein
MLLQAPGYSRACHTTPTPGSCYGMRILPAQGAGTGLWWGCAAEQGKAERPLLTLPGRSGAGVL